MPHPKVKISDDSGNTVAVDTSGASNALKVVLADSDTIDIGNVVLTNSAGNNIHVAAADDDALDLDDQLLLGTHALLSARNDANTTIGLTCLDSTHNALHVAISDGAGIANVDGNNALLVDVVAGGVLESAVDGIEGILTTITHVDDVGFTLGTDSGVMMMGFAGLQSVNSNDAAALICSTSGQLKVVVDSAPSTAVTNAGTFATQIDGDALTALELVAGAVGADGAADVVKCVSIAGTQSSGVLQEIAVDAIGNLQVDVLNFPAQQLVANAGTFAVQADHAITGMVSDLDADVGTTAEKIHTAADVAIKRIDIQAHPDNTGLIYVGDSGVAGNGSGGGIALAAGDFYSLDIDNTGDVYVASSVVDEDVSYIYYT